MEPLKVWRQKIYGRVAAGPIGPDNVNAIIEWCGAKWDSRNGDHVYIDGAGDEARIRLGEYVCRDEDGKFWRHDALHVSRFLGRGDDVEMEQSYDEEAEPNLDLVPVVDLLRALHAQALRQTELLESIARSVAEYP